MRFGLVSTSPRLAGADVETMRALLLAADAMLARAWDLVPATCNAYATVADVPADAVPLLFAPTDAEAAGVLGYHDDGTRVFARVLVEPTLAAGGGLFSGPTSLFSVAMHEWCETRVDPYANSWADGPDGVQHALEACDAVEGVVLKVTAPSGAQADGEDFVLPRWFDPIARGAVDAAGVLSASFTLASTGYEVVRDRNGNASQRFGSPAALAARRLSPRRRALRRLLSL